MGTSYSREPFFRVLNYEESVDALKEAEHTDRYNELVGYSSSNQYARLDGPYTPYDLTPDEIMKMEEHLQTIQTQIPQRLLKSLEFINVICLVPSAESGMPHTRPGNIMCTAHGAPLTFEICLHELWHIHQRQFKYRWDGFFTERWFFSPWQGSLPEDLERSRRFNPDTIDTPLWIWKDTWVPVPIMTNVSQPSLRETEIWFFNAATNIRVREPPQEMQKFFSRSINKMAYEHPREMSAYMLTQKPNLSIPAYSTLMYFIGKSPR